MPSGITEIDLLDEKIACGQLIERYRCWHLSKVTHKSLRLATRCQTQPLAILRRPMRDHSRRPWPGAQAVRLDHPRRICAGGACRPRNLRTREATVAGGRAAFTQAERRASRPASTRAAMPRASATVLPFLAARCMPDRFRKRRCRPLRASSGPASASGRSHGSRGAARSMRRASGEFLAHVLLSYRDRIASCRCLATVNSSWRSRSRVRPRVLIAWQLGHSAIICSGWSGPPFARSWIWSTSRIG